MGLWDTLKTIFRSEAADVKDGLESMRDKLDVELTRRERELDATPTERIDMLHEEMAQTDSAFDRIADQIEAKSEAVAAREEVAATVEGISAEDISAEDIAAEDAGAGEVEPAHAGAPEAEVPDTASASAEAAAAAIADAEAKRAAAEQAAAQIAAEKAAKDAEAAAAKAALEAAEIEAGAKATLEELRAEIDNEAAGD